MRTFFPDGKNLKPFIPSDIFERDQDSAWWDEGNIVYCCNWSNFAYHVEGDEIFLELMWVHEAPEGFLFSTYHMLDQALLSLLEAVRAINRFDGHADLLALSSYEYDIGFQKLDEGYIVTKIEPQDDSYHCNIKAFYDPITVLSNLQDQAFRSVRLPDASQSVALEFAYETEGECVYFPWIYAEILEHELLRYDIRTDTYRFTASISMVDAIKEGYVYLHWRGMENSYNTRIENTDSFRHLLARVKALNPDGTIDTQEAILYSVQFELVLRRKCSIYECVNLQLLQKEDGYWEYLMRLAELERESNAE